MDERILKEHAYSITMAIQTMVEALGMIAENQCRADQGKAPAYGEKAFVDLVNNNGCHHNAFLARWQRATS